jgi:hypothetical protein
MAAPSFPKMPKVGGWEREQLRKTVPQPKGNFLMELRDLHFHGSGILVSKYNFFLEKF